MTSYIGKLISYWVKQFNITQLRIMVTEFVREPLYLNFSHFRIVKGVNWMRRNNLDIYADILNISRNGAKKTQIVYKANLSFEIMKKHVQVLSDKGLIEQSGRLYFTTDRGVNYIDQYRDFITPLNGNVGAITI